MTDPTDRTPATREQGLEAIRALGYTGDDNVLSVLISVQEISIRRVVKHSGGWSVVEDRTLFKLDGNLVHEHSVPVGPMNTSPEAGQGG